MLLDQLRVTAEFGGVIWCGLIEVPEYVGEKFRQAFAKGMFAVLLHRANTTKRISRTDEQSSLTYRYRSSIERRIVAWRTNKDLQDDQTGIRVFCTLIKFVSRVFIPTELASNSSYSFVAYLHGS